ncbi:unnamed protein product [Phytophthora fragariaefolia]|uniref:Unnamed protein product n=1 Tax=Phytophthora fragariaefolia TaxID=1490495 RepID=A0A9W6UCR6_9STRA|nr:unnamed protein product [Phytophthora fragariaefolia]
MNSVHAQLGYAFHVCLNANKGVMVEAWQEIIIEEAVVPAKPLLGLEVPLVPAHAVHLGAALLDTDPFLIASLDKPAYQPGETLRVRCRVNPRSGDDDSFTAFLRLYEDVDVTVAPSKRSEGSRLLYEKRFQIAASAEPFELALELAAGPGGAPAIARSFRSSFVERKHRLAVEVFPPSGKREAKSDMALVIL